MRKLMHNSSLLFFFGDPAASEFYTLSLHDALPISTTCPICARASSGVAPRAISSPARRLRPLGWKHVTIRSRSEEHTSELQSRRDLVCRLLLEKKKSVNAARMQQLPAPRGSRRPTL